MAAPETLTITEFNGPKVVINGAKYDVLPKGALDGFAPGGTFKGWLNPDGQYGAYVKVADKQNGATNAPQSAQASPAAVSQGSFPPPNPPAPDAKDRSIERQVAAYCTTALIGQEGFTGIPDDQFPAVFRRTLNAIHAAIRDEVPF